MLRRMSRWHLTRVAIAWSFLGLALTNCAERTGPLALVPPESAHGGGALSGVTCDAENGGITLPAGFCATVFADSIGAARHIAVRPNGDVYVAIKDVPGTHGGVVGLRDTDGDGHADQSVRFGRVGGNGVAWGGKFLFFAQNDRVVRFPFDQSQSLGPSASAVVVVSGLPATGDHVSKTVVVASRSSMYINIGSSSNSCQVSNRQLNSPGIDPCPEMSTRAGVWQVDPSRANQKTADMQRVATGLRNMVALAMHPTGTLYGVQMDRDNLSDNWPTLFSQADDAQLPAEELLRIDQGADYGWPYCYFDELQDRKVLAPEYGGDRTTVGRCAAAANPLASLPAHWAPLSILFYSGTMFPASYRGGAFIAFHGDYFWGTRPRVDSPGYNVAFIPFNASGTPSGPWQVFADGFAGPGAVSRTTAEHRPTGIAQAPDGALYIADDVGGRVWRVFYR